MLDHNYFLLYLFTFLILTSNDTFHGRFFIPLPNLPAFPALELDPSFEHTLLLALITLHYCNSLLTINLPTYLEDWEPIEGKG